VRVDLYAIICECLEVLIEDFNSGDIALPVFSSKVERILGPISLYDATNEHAFEWVVLDQGGGYDLYYASDNHSAHMQIRLVKGNRFVHALIKHEENAAPAEDAENAENAVETEPLTAHVEASAQGCDDPECVSCNITARVKATLESAGLLSVNVMSGGSVLPEGVLLSFGRLKRDEN
jgi:hypothetical protein